MTEDRDIEHVIRELGDRLTAAMTEWNPIPSPLTRDAEVSAAYHHGKAWAYTIALGMLRRVVTPKGKGIMALTEKTIPALNTPQVLGRILSDLPAPELEVFVSGEWRQLLDVEIHFPHNGESWLHCKNWSSEVGFDQPIPTRVCTGTGDAH
jgi:hypothetical protein